MNCLASFEAQETSCQLAVEWYVSKMIIVQSSRLSPSGWERNTRVSLKEMDVYCQFYKVLYTFHHLFMQIFYLGVYSTGKSKLQVPDTGMSQYWSILEHFWCTSIARKCDTYVL